MSIRLQLNYNFASDPQATSDYVDVLFGGSLQYGDEPALPVTNPPIPPSDDTSKMLYLTASQQIANVFLNVCFQRFFLDKIKFYSTF